MMPRVRIALLCWAAIGSAAAANDLPPGVIARLGSPVLRHPDRPVCLTFAPDGSRIASGGTDGTLRVWDALTGAELHRLAVPDAVCTAVAFSPDGKLLAVNFGDEQVRLLDVKTFKQVRTVPVTPLDTVALSKDGRLVGGVGMAGKLHLVEAATGLDRMELPNGRALAFAPDGSAVAVADPEETVAVYEVPSGKPGARVRHPNRDGVTAVAVSPDGRRLVTADPGETGRVRVWDARTGEKLGEWPGQGPVAFLMADRVIHRRGGSVTVTTVATGRPIREFDAGAETFAVSADGSRLATAGGGARIRVWDLESGQERGVAGGELGEVTALAPTPDGRGLVVASAAGVQWWAPGAPAVGLLTARPGAVGLAGRRLAATSGTGVGVWDLPTAPKELPALPDRVQAGITGPVRAVGGTADGARLAVATDEARLAVVAPATGRVLRSWVAPSPVLAVTVTPAGDRVTGVGRDGFVRCWDVTAAIPAEVWKVRIPRSQHAQVAAPADGRFVAVSTVIRVSLFDAATGAAIHSFERKWEDGPYRAVAVSPDGRLVAAGATGSGGAVTVWEVATRTVLRRFVGGTGTIRYLTFLDGGRSVATVGADENVTVWDLTGRHGKPAPADAEVKRAWGQLLRDEAEGGVPPVWVLAAAGPQGVAAVRDGLAETAKTRERVKKLIAELDADAFPARQAAAAALKELGVQALPALAAAAASHPSPEVRQRAEKVVADLARGGVVIPPHGLVGEQLRQVRAVAVLEAIGTPDAAAVLEEMVKFGGRPGAEAELALKRMRK
jgi:WD40 repeat protein